MTKELFKRKREFSGIHAIDQSSMNNGGHDEFIIFKFGGYKSRDAKFCVVEYDIYGKAVSYILEKKELVEKFGKEIMGDIPEKSN